MIKTIEWSHFVWFTPKIYKFLGVFRLSTSVLLVNGYIFFSCFRKNQKSCIFFPLFYFQKDEPKPLLWNQLIMDHLRGLKGLTVSYSVRLETTGGFLTESLRMLRNVLLSRMQNWVLQLAEKLWQPSDEEPSWGEQKHSAVRRHFGVLFHRLIAPGLRWHSEITFSPGGVWFLPPATAAGGGWRLRSAPSDGRPQTSCSEPPSPVSPSGPRTPRRPPPWL